MWCLVGAGAVIDGGRPLFVAALYGQLRVVQFLITFVCDVDSVDSEGRSALYFASKSGHKDIVKFLYGRGNCDVNKADCDGSTALHVAAYFGNELTLTTLDSRNQLRVARTLNTRSS